MNWRRRRTVQSNPSEIPPDDPPNGPHDKPGCIERSSTCCSGLCVYPLFHTHMLPLKR